jgi:glycerol-3-phosphate acyltransferase
VYLASEAEKRKWQPLSRSKYPKPLIFHDGRIALRPTPANSLAIFLWLPLSIPLGITRAIACLLLPHYLYIPILSSLGMVSRKIVRNPQESEHVCTDTDMDKQNTGNDNFSKGQIYVCNHRTLLDPLYISGAIGRHVSATTYSVSRVAEILSPIKTIRLTRKKEVDRKKMEDLLNEGDIVVCPEGTTCREPYLLRFSPLFAQLNRSVTPVALTSQVSMFYGTTATGRKYLDPLYFLMNPWPCYTVEFLDKVDASNGDNLGKRWNSHYEVANYVQSKIGKALGYECTTLTRRDKYLMLADNEGIVENLSK